MIPTAAVLKELNSLRRNGVAGEALLKTVIHIYRSHRLRDRLDREDEHEDKSELPRIICSEAI